MRINDITQALSAEMRKTESARKPEKQGKATTPAADKSEFSADAQNLSATRAQFSTIAASVSAQSDVRTDKVAEVKEKIQNGYYDSDEFIDKLADKLLTEFGVKQSGS